MKKNKTSSLEYACMEMSSYQTKRPKLYPDAFLRKPYKYTKAETKDDTQENLHEYDYRRDI